MREMNFCNTQFGNNNAYCQDNIISWLDWTRLEKYQEIHDFFRYMIAFREKYPILRRSTKKDALRPTGDQYPQWFPVEWGYGIIPVN